jgi:hypothetical protein
MPSAASANEPRRASADRRSAGEIVEGMDHAFIQEILAVSCANGNCSEASHVAREAAMTGIDKILHKPLTACGLIDLV